MRQGFVLAFVAALVIGSGLAALRLSRNQNRAQPDGPSSPLRIVAARYPRGFSFTNVGRATVTHCIAQVSDGRNTWTAVVDQPLPPSASATVAWSDFRIADQAMSGYRKGSVTVGCNEGDEKHRRYVVLGMDFDQNTPDRERVRSR